MSTPVAVNKLEVRPFAKPDELRAPDKSRVEIVRLQGYALARMTFQPGWRWSSCIKPLAQTDTCQLSHVGCAVSGKLTVRMQDGTEKTISAGDSYAIPPGHDAWVDGNEPFVGIEIMSAEEYAKV